MSAARLRRRETSRRPRDAGSVLLRAGATPIRVLFVRCPELVALLPAILKGWDWNADPSGRPPVVSITSLRSGYRLAAPWLLEGVRLATPVAAVCRLVVELARAWLEHDRSLLCLHCAAVRSEAGLVVFPSTWRAGKSTLVAALAAAGMRVHADDIMPLDAGGEGIASGVAPRLRLPLPATVRRSLSPLIASATGPSDGRYLYLDLPPALLAGRGERAPVAAFVVLERSAGARPVFRWIEPAEMLRHVVPRNFSDGPDAEAALARLATLVARVPCLALRYGNPARAAEFLRDSFAHGPPEVPGSGPAHRGALKRRPGRSRAVTGRRFVACASVAAQRVGGELFLADRRSGAICALDPVGAAVWRRLGEPASAAEIASELGAAFPGTSAAAMTSDVAALLAELHRAGLVAPA